MSELLEFFINTAMKRLRYVLRDQPVSLVEVEDQVRKLAARANFEGASEIDRTARSKNKEPKWVRRKYREARDRIETFVEDIVRKVKAAASEGRLTVEAFRKVWVEILQSVGRKCNDFFRRVDRMVVCPTKLGEAGA